jgi:hypothetical protein
VVVEVDNKVIVSGEPLKGVVSLLLDVPYPMPVDKITVELTGKEKVMWDGSDSKQKDHKHSGKIVIKRIIIKIVQDITYFDKGLVQPGLHKFPFTFELPPDLPSSFFYVGEKGANIQI